MAEIPLARKLQPIASPPYPLQQDPPLEENAIMSAFDSLIPITLFLCIFLSIKTVVDARFRGKLLQTGGAEELLRSMARDEDIRRRHGALRWGIVMVLLAIGFGIIQGAGWQEVNAGSIAVMLGAAGLGNLIYFFLARKLG